MLERLYRTPLKRSAVAKIKEDGSGCWIWTGARQAKGYGNIRHGGRDWRVHRLVYRLLVGPIGEGLVLHHKCGNKPCCNPDHLEAVTQAKNVRLSTVSSDASLGIRVRKLEEALLSLLEVAGDAINAGDWRVDGACDPGAALSRARAILLEAYPEIARLNEMAEAA